MAVHKITENVFSVGAVDWSRTLFDELIPLPDGTSYNSYVVKTNDGSVILDGVDPVKWHIMNENLESAGINDVKYIVSHHAEQDHSGAIVNLVEKYPKAKVLTNEKCKLFLIEHLEIDESRFVVVADREKIIVGGLTFEFILTPWVHWPETMITYLHEKKILFSCDFFGSHLAQSQLFVEDCNLIYEPAKRYFAEIMMPFSALVKGHLAKVRNLAIDYICPSHGPVHDKPDYIISAYENWVDSNKVKNMVVIPYVSMHDSTKIAVNYLSEALMKRGVNVRPFNLTVADTGELAMSLVDAASLIIATPTVLTGPHPKAVYAAYFANALRPKTKFMSAVISYGWGSRALEMIKGSLTALKGDFIDPIEFKGVPKNNDFKSLDAMAQTFADKHKEIGIL